MPVERITPEMFEKLVDLAAIGLDPTQSEYLRSELNKQLTAIHELMAIHLDESLPLALHGTPYTQEDVQALREDIWAACENPQEIIAQAPVTEDGYLRVPEIPHQELE